MNKKVRERILKLQAQDLPRMSHRNFINPESPFHNVLNMAMIVNHEAELDDYFKDYAVPQKTDDGKDVKCVQCGERLVIEWALEHGIAKCYRRSCGWPSRVYHYKIPHQERIVMGLQFHPSAIEVEPADAMIAERGKP